ncbi:MAG: hypothetical protein H6658_10655 [Ardenticatenaceae bacterium]|nr:hypothetical protein [Ardenticatenaceae bacterium]
MKTPILLKAAMIGIALIIALSFISTAVSYPILQDMMGMMSDPAFFDPTTTPSGLPPGFEGLFNFMPIITILGCLMQIIPGMIAGGLYARWHNQDKPVVPGAVKGGAAAGAIAHAIGYTISGFVGLAIMLPLQLQMMETVFDAAGAPPAAFPFGGSMILFGAIGLVCGAIFQALFGAGFGAIGGLIGDSFAKGKAHDYAGGDVIG